MPKDFDKCVREGGTVTTKHVNSTMYMHLCQDKSGKWHAGEEKMYKKLKGRKGK